MPRRKRKISPSRKPPLEFEESPLNIPHGTVSPVFASDHPCYADVVPIDETVSTTWVSPQFMRVPTSHRVTRAMRKRKGGNPVAGIAEATQQRSATPKKKKNSKLVPLRFEGDKSPEPPSPIQELTYENPTQIQDIEGEKNIDEDVESGEHSVIFKKHNIDNGLHQNREKVDMQLLDNLYGLEATGAFKRLQQHEQHMAESTGEELPTDFTSIKRKSRRKKSRKPLPDLGSDSSLLEECNKDDCVGNNDRNEYLSENGESCANNEIGTRSPVLGTQKRPVPGKSKVKTKLFTAESAGSSEPGSINADRKSFTALENLMEALPNISSADVLPDIRTPDCSVLKRLQTPLSARTNIQDVSSSETECTPRRKNYQSTQLRRLVCTPKSGTPNSRISVLVYDTPEEDYGVSVRQRRLRQWKK